MGTVLAEMKTQPTLTSSVESWTDQFPIRQCDWKRALKCDFKVQLRRLGKSTSHIVIEMDGIQHFQPTRFNGYEDENELKRAFEKGKERDRRKDLYCRSRPGWYMVRISHSVCRSRYRSILQNVFNQVGGEQWIFPFGKDYVDVYPTHSLRRLPQGSLDG